MSTNQPVNGAELLARIRPKRRTESTHITLRPDLIHEWQQVHDELASIVGPAEAANAAKRLAAPLHPRARELAERVKELEKLVDESAVEFVLESMSKDEWRALCANHPPRPDNKIDEMVGYDRDAVLDEAVRECMVSPAFEDCDVDEDDECDHTDCGSWQAFLNVCTPSEWEELRSTVNYVNRSVNESPKSELASRILARRDSDSK